MKTFERKKEITVPSNTQQVLLSTRVGNGDMGGGNVRLKGSDQVIATGLLNRFALGTNQDVKGKTFVVTTNGLDINPFRDDIPVTHIFTGAGFPGGEVKFVYPEQGDEELLAEDDGLISYVIEYTFN